MSEKDTLNSEQAIDTGASELSSEPHADTNSEQSVKSLTAEQVREGHLRSALEKIGYDNGNYSQKLLDTLPPSLNYLKDDIMRKAQEDKSKILSTDDFERLYNERRDKEYFEETLPKVVKENYLTSDQADALAKEVESLVKNNNMSHKQALDYATRSFSARDSFMRGMKTAAGAVAPYPQSSNDNGFVPIPLSKYDSMSHSERKEYSAKSKQMHGEVVFK